MPTSRTATPTITGGMAMPDAASVLHAWLSPGYPVGAFAYSHGLETAIADESISDAASLERWLQDLIVHGGGWTDAVLLAAAWTAPEDDAPAGMARALAVSAERLTETMAQGTAFADVTSAAWGHPVLPAAYPVAFGRAAAAHGLPLRETLTVFLQAFAANLVSSAVRLVPLGQTDGQAVVARLVPLCAETAERAARSSLDDVGGCALRSDIAAMRHESQTVRLFRT